MAITITKQPKPRRTTNFTVIVKTNDERTTEATHFQFSRRAPRAKQRDEGTLSRRLPHAHEELRRF